MKDPNNPCIFCKVRKEELQFENQLAYSSIDSYPVSKFHSLIVPKRHVQEYFELSTEEVQACHELILKTKEKILKFIKMNKFNSSPHIAAFYHFLMFNG